MESLISLKQVSKSFGKHQVLKNIDFTLYPGQSVAFIGHNGCGKSTLLRIMTGLTNADKGQVKIKPELKIACIPERFPQISMTLKTYLEAMGRIDGCSKEEAKKQCEKWLMKFHMKDMEDTPLKFLSKGSLQKAAVIQALMTDCEVLMMDEPLSGQDADARNIFVKLINEKKKKKLAIIMSCHEQSLIEQVSDVLYEIEEGQLKECKLEMLHKDYDLREMRHVQE